MFSTWVHKDYLVTKEGYIISFKRNTPKLMKPNKMSCGYYRVDLWENNKPHTYLIHRLMLELFKGKSQLEVNHRDGDKSNNRLENLEYCTSSENKIHGYKLGLYGSGGKHGRSRKVRNLKTNKIYLTIKNASELTGDGIHTIHRHLGGKVSDNNTRWIYE